MYIYTYIHIYSLCFLLPAFYFFGVIRNLDISLHMQCHLCVCVCVCSPCFSTVEREGAKTLVAAA